MTVQEALTAIVDGLENIEEYDEPLSVLRDTVEKSTSTEGDDGEDWKGKYMKLSEKYKTRFKDLTSPATETETKETVEEKENADITMDDIDFTAKNE